MQTVFRGETLRGLLLNAYGFWQMGQIMLIGAIVAFVAAAVMLILSLFGIAHLRRVPAEAEIFSGHTATATSPHLRSEPSGNRSGSQTREAGTQRSRPPGSVVPAVAKAGARLAPSPGPGDMASTWLTLDSRSRCHYRGPGPRSRWSMTDIPMPGGSPRRIVIAEDSIS